MSLAVMFLAIITPFSSTVTTDSSLDFHVTALFVASAGATVAVSVVVEDAVEIDLCLW